ncbi:MAG: DNA cytosine methyltransferase [Ruminococcus flavefaciens]|nr:DNA cytosine methyltransferase [Ruminococcus flavefaciens]
MSNNRNVLSLFSSAGIGELGVEAAGLSILVNNELVQNRCDIYRENYPSVHTICGDIWEKEDEIISAWNERCSDAPFLVYATPPCQGMSSNGAGKLLSEIRKGNRNPDDPRNRLVIPTMHIVKALHPVWMLLENVPTMSNTIICDENGEYINIIDYVQRELGEEYSGVATVVNCADYGIPQMRKRLITIFTRSENGKAFLKKHGSFLPPATHSEEKTLFTERWITLRDAIGSLPPLDARKGKNERKDYHPWHFVPIMNAEKYWWMENTPEGCTAYNNQCVNPMCGYQGNRLHGSNTDGGLHSANKDTPIFCEKCGELLPRPTLVDKKTGQRRLLKGYDTAYRRMEWDAPAATLTQNFIFEASDKKVHPSQTRVLSIYEALILQTIADYEYSFTINGEYISKNLCAEIIGESVPPKLIEMVCKQIVEISQGE